MIPCSGPFAFGQGETLALANQSTLSVRDLAAEENRDFVLSGDIYQLQFTPRGQLVVAIETGTIGSDVIVLDADSGKETAAGSTMTGSPHSRLLRART